VVIGPTTRLLIGDLFELVNIGAHALKGFAAPIQLWRVQREGKAESRFEALHGASLTPLVGREHEVGLLLERFQRARDGEGQVVLLSGEPGIGKSRLIGALRERLRSQPYMLLSHFCSPFHVNSAFQPVIGMLERTARFERDEPPTYLVAKLEALLAFAGVSSADAVALLAALLSIPVSPREPQPALGPDVQKRCTLELLVDLVAGLTARQPVLAVYEDLHWVDPSTLELLGQIVERIEHLPILCILSFRPGFTPPWPPHGHIAPLPLGRLGRRQGASMIEVIAGGRSLPPELMDQIAAKTDGVPLFLEELTKSLLESGQLQERGGRYELAGALPSLTIPSTLQDSLVARLDRLGAAKETMQLGSALGREFGHDLLAAVSPLRERELRAALAQIVATGLLIQRGSPPDLAYSFQHALVQDAAYAGLLKRRRQEIHSRIAQVLIERFPARVAAQPELLAHHHTEAGEVEAAADRWLEAGRRSTERSANAEAVAHLKHGLEIIKALPAGSARDCRELDLLVALGVPLIATKGYGAPEIDEIYSRA
ncbi:MAG: AAA family ATPase, partial [Hypericibacter sp.]